MIISSNQDQLKEAILDCINADRSILASLRDEIRPLKSATRRIHPRSTTSISLVATDGGNNQLKFDPFLIQLVRVVDSSNNEYCLEAVSPTTPIANITARQFGADGTPCTNLGKMMRFLGVDDLSELSHMIRPKGDNTPPSPKWVAAYRELVEWATLFALLEKDFGTDTLIIYDGLLRSMVFARDLFSQLLEGMQQRITQQYDSHRRHIYLVGVAKHSKVLTRYHLAMALEGILRTEYPAYVEVPRDIEERAYVRSEYARGNDWVREDGGKNRFVGGKMFLVKFGSRTGDPVWPVDIFLPQVSAAQSIIGAMLADAIEGFPVPYYPRSLQKAHTNAALVDFDYDILQSYIYEGIRNNLGEDGEILDIFKLRDVDPSLARY